MKKLITFEIVAIFFLGALLINIKSSLPHPNKLLGQVSPIKTVDTKFNSPMTLTLVFVTQHGNQYEVSCEGECDTLYTNLSGIEATYVKVKGGY